LEREITDHLGSGTEKSSNRATAADSLQIFFCALPPEMKGVAKKL
jgi:hypothetical protein